MTMYVHTKYIVDLVRAWSCSYVIMYIRDHIHTKPLPYTSRLCHNRFDVHSERATAASAHAQWAPQQLLCMLGKRLSSLCSCSASASAASAHAQCAPQQFPRTLRVRQSFWKFQGTASAYTEYAPKPLYCMLRGRRSCFSILSESASAASAHAQSAPKLCNSPNSGRIKKPFF